MQCLDSIILTPFELQLVTFMAEHVNQGTFSIYKVQTCQFIKCHCMLVLVCVLLIVINNARYKLTLNVQL